jgi:hypothetical protein
MSTVTPRQAVYAHLLADSEVSALVGNRVYHQTPDKDAVYPLIVLNTISNVDRRDLSTVFACDTRIQITAMANALKEAEDIAMAARRSLEGFSGIMAGALLVIGCIVDNFFPDYQDEVKQTHYHVDVIITHKGVI